MTEGSYAKESEDANENQGNKGRNGNKDNKVTYVTALIAFTALTALSLQPHPRQHEGPQREPAAADEQTALTDVVTERTANAP